MSIRRAIKWCNVCSNCGQMFKLLRFYLSLSLPLSFIFIILPCQLSHFLGNVLFLDICFFSHISISMIISRCVNFFHKSFSWKIEEKLSDLTNLSLSFTIFLNLT